MNLIKPKALKDLFVVVVVVVFFVVVVIVVEVSAAYESVFLQRMMGFQLKFRVILVHGPHASRINTCLLDRVF